jgi:hypothetical protein
MNTKQLELQQRIKLLMEYDMKKTLTENIHPILEQSGWLKFLGVADNVLDDIIKKGTLKTTSGTSVKSMGELRKLLRKNSTTVLDDVSQTLLNLTFLKNPAIPYEAKKDLIKSFSENSTIIQQYSNKTNKQIYDKFINSKFPDDVAEEIANKIKPKTNSGSLTTTMSQELSRDSKDLFGNIGKKLTSSQIEELNRASSQIIKGVSKLTNVQIVGLENSLKSMGISLDTLIQKLSKAKDLRSQERVKNLKKVLDTVVSYTNTASKSVGNTKILYLSKAALVAMAGATILAGVNWASKTSPGQWVIENMPDVWSHIKALGPPTTTPGQTTTPEQTTTPAPESTPAPEEDDQL